MLIESLEVEKAIGRLEDRVRAMRKRAAQVNPPGASRDPLEIEADGITWAVDVIKKAAAARPRKLHLVMGGARRAVR